MLKELQSSQAGKESKSLHCLRSKSLSHSCMNLFGRESEEVILSANKAFKTPAQLV